MTFIKPAAVIFALVFVSACAKPAEEAMMKSGEDTMMSGEETMMSDGAKK